MFLLLFNNRFLLALVWQCVALCFVMRKFVENLAKGKMLRKKNDSQANSRFLTLLCASSCPCCRSFQCLVAFSPQNHRNISNAFSFQLWMSPDSSQISGFLRSSQIRILCFFHMFLPVFPTLFPPRLDEPWQLLVSLCFMQRFLKVTIFW